MVGRWSSSISLANPRINGSKMPSSEILINRVLPQMLKSHCHSGIVSMSTSPNDLPSKTPVQEVNLAEKCTTKRSDTVYSAILPSHRRFILAIITVAGLFGPLAGNIYLPALSVIARQFHRSETEINITVTVSMIVFAFGVSYNTPVLELPTEMSRVHRSSSR